MTSFITGIIVAICTFPGVILRQVVTQLLCLYFRIPVFKVTYFQPWPPFGKVDFEPPRRASTGLAIILVPAIITTLVGFLTGAPAFLAFFTSDTTPLTSLIDLFLIWLGISFAVNSFPTTEQAMTVKRLLVVPENSTLVRSTGEFLMIAMYACALGSIVWLDVIYALFVVVGIPLVGHEMLRAAR
jgi:hypothetical protein